MTATVVVERRFRGPPASGNGGYTCGLVAGLVGGPAEVTLRAPPPLDTPLTWDGACLRDGDTVVAEAAPGAPAMEVPEPPSPAEARAASRRYAGFESHAFPTCFVCGPERAPGDGLRVFAGPVEGSGLVAAPWTPAEDLADADGRVRAEFVWAALDCPGAFAVGFSERRETLLGRMAAEVFSRPQAGEECVVAAWPLGEEGRKLHAATALWQAGRLLGGARQTWIAPR